MIPISDANDNMAHATSADFTAHRDRPSDHDVNHIATSAMRPRNIPYDPTFDDISSGEIQYENMNMLYTGSGPIRTHLQATTKILVQVAHSRDENGTEYFEHNDDDDFFLMCPSNFDNIRPPPILSDEIVKGRTLPVSEATPSSITHKPRPSLGSMSMSMTMTTNSDTSRALRRNTHLSLHPRLCRHPPFF